MDSFLFVFCHVLSMICSRGPILSDDSDDETAMLMAELNKIKAEKQQEEEEKVINDAIHIADGLTNTI